MGKYSKTYWEFGTEAKASSVSVHSPELNAGNIAAQETLRAAFEAAVDAVSLGSPGSEEFVATLVEVAKTPSANPLAQRENKWLVSYKDNTTNRGGTFTIPTADLALLQADGVNMDAASDEYADLVTAAEAFVRSPLGNTITVTSIRFTARNI